MLVGIVAKIRNGPMLKYRLDQGGIGQAEAAKRAEVGHSVWCAVECMRFKNVSWDSVRKIARLLDCHTNEIFPPELHAVNLSLTMIAFKETEAERLLAHSTSKRLLLRDPSVVVEENELKGMVRERIDRALRVLTYREREIIKLRYGLNPDGHCYTLSEVSKIFRVNKERVRQVQAEGIRKLQKATSLGGDEVVHAALDIDQISD